MKDGDWKSLTTEANRYIRGRKRRKPRDANTDQSHGGQLNVPDTDDQPNNESLDVRNAGVMTMFRLIPCLAASLICSTRFSLS